MNNIDINNIPEELRGYDQWVAWKWEKRNGKPTKPPYDAKTGKRASHSNPETWGTFEQAFASYNSTDSTFDGIGFVFSAEDPFCGIDLDDCIDAVSGTIEPWASKIITDFNSYTEVSPSGTGVKIFIKGHLPRAGIRNGKIEVYDNLRYFTVTGQVYGGVNGN